MIGDPRGHRWRLLATCHAQTLVRRPEVVDGADQIHAILGSVSKVEMVTIMALIYKGLCPSISTFETPPAGAFPRSKTGKRLIGFLLPLGL